LALGEAGGEDKEATVPQLVQTLRELGFSELAKETGVSIARFARVAKLMATAQVSEDNADRALYGGVHEHVSAIVLTFLWMKAHTRQEILDFLIAVDMHHSVLDVNAASYMSMNGAVVCPVQGGEGGEGAVVPETKVPYESGVPEAEASRVCAMRQ
jgi:hypothetical protein